MNLGVLFLIVANPMIYRLVPRPSRFETRQYWGRSKRIVGMSQGNHFRPYKGLPFLSKMVYERVRILLDFGAKPPHIKTMLSSPSFPSHHTLVMMVVH